MKFQFHTFCWMNVLMAILIFSSCQFDQSVETDLTTGAYTRGNGIGCDDVIIEVSGREDNRNEFVYGEKVNLIFNDINGLTTIDNKAYPGMGMYVVKNEKDTVLANADLLDGIDDGTDLRPLQLIANFRTAMPYQNNEEYKVFVDIWDKKGEGRYSYELPFTVKENELLDIKSNGISYTNIYLWNESRKAPVFDGGVSTQEVLLLILEGIDGMELKDDKVFPVFSIELTDARGNVILSNPQLLGESETLGVSAVDLKSQLAAEVTFTEGRIYNPCQLTSILKDKNSSKEIRIKTELNVQ